MELVILVCLVALAVFIIIMLVLIIINSFCKYNGIFFCKFFGWHKKPKDIEIRGINNVGTCPRCGKRVIQDSQGNWFQDYCYCRSSQREDSLKKDIPKLITVPVRVDKLNAMIVREKVIEYIRNMLFEKAYFLKKGKLEKELKNWRINKIFSS